MLLSWWKKKLRIRRFAEGREKGTKKWKWIWGNFTGCGRKKKDDEDWRTHVEELWGKKYKSKASSYLISKRMIWET
jgi:hypothetical protein